MTAFFFVFSASASDLRSRLQCVGCDALWEATTIRTAWVVLLTYHRFQCGSWICINILPSYAIPQTICQLLTLSMAGVDIRVDWRTASRRIRTLHIVQTSTRRTFQRPSYTDELDTFIILDT